MCPPILFQDIAPKSLRCGRIAQLGEHLPYKQRVIGSSPIVPTTFLFKGYSAMRFDLLPILNADGRRLSVDAELDFVGKEEQGAVFLTPVRVTGEFLNIGGSIEFEARVSCRVRYECDRCLESYEDDFACSFKEIFKKEDVKNGDEQSPDVIILEGTAVELDEIVLLNIIVHLPHKHLCKNDCKGLCPNCGQNLNLGSCDCDMRPTDPRFDILDKLL